VSAAGYVARPAVAGGPVVPGDVFRSRARHIGPDRKISQPV